VSVSCPLCKDYHDFPANFQFPLCKQIKDLLMQQPKEVYRGVLAETLKSNLNDIRLKINELSGDITDSLEKIKIHCQLLRKEVNQTTDYALKYIQEVNKNMINEIDDYESELMKPFEINKNADTELAIFIDDLNNFHIQWDR
jgi:hypothetical protein